MKHPQHKRAFTLVEVLIALVLLSIMFGGMTSILYAMMVTHVENAKHTGLSKTNRILSERLNREMRLASDILETSSPTTLRILPADSNAPEIRYVFNNGTLYYQTIKDGNTSSYILLDGTTEVQPTSFTIELERTTVDSSTVTTLARVDIGLVAEGVNGAMSQTITAKAAPRSHINSGP